MIWSQNNLNFHEKEWKCKKCRETDGDCVSAPFTDTEWVHSHSEQSGRWRLKFLINSSLLILRTLELCLSACCCFKHWAARTPHTPTTHEQQQQQKEKGRDCLSAEETQRCFHSIENCYCTHTLRVCYWTQLIWTSALLPVTDFDGAGHTQTQIHKHTKPAPPHPTHTWKMTSIWMKDRSSQSLCLVFFITMKIKI